MPPESVVAIGVFDGVHRGHARIVDRCVRVARAAGQRPTVLTFEPHPRLTLRGEAPARLSSPMTRGHDLKKLGIEVVSCLNFTLDVGALEPETFIREVLLSHLGARAVVVGPGFRFGAERRGGLDSFVARDDRRAIEVFVEEPVEDDAGPVSSTRVRAALALADLDRAARLLGRRYAIRGPIVRGDARGRTLGYPTANVELSGVNALARGVYAGWAVLEDAAAARRRVAAAINLGLRPTVAGEDLRCEAHLLDFAGDLYGQTLRLEPLVHLRPERRFASVDDLRAAIGRDVEATRAIVSAS